MVEMRTQFCCHRLKYECRNIVGNPQKLRDYDLRYIVSPRLFSYCSLFLKHQINAASVYRQQLYCCRYVYADMRAEMC